MTKIQNRITKTIDSKKWSSQLQTEQTTIRKMSLTESVLQQFDDERPQWCCSDHTLQHRCWGHTHEVMWSLPHTHLVLHQCVTTTRCQLQWLSLMTQQRSNTPTKASRTSDGLVCFDDSTASPAQQHGNMTSFPVAELLVQRLVVFTSKKVKGQTVDPTFCKATLVPMHDFSMIFHQQLISKDVARELLQGKYWPWNRTQWNSMTGPLHVRKNNTNMIHVIHMF